MRAPKPINRYFFVNFFRNAVSASNLSPRQMSKKSFIPILKTLHPFYTISLDGCSLINILNKFEKKNESLGKTLLLSRNSYS